MPRFHCPTPLATGLTLSLPPGAARHVQVLRLQPGDVITLFNGEGGEFDATVSRMGRSDVEVEVGAHRPVERETARAVHLLAGITANDRMDWLVEKATELGVASITPLVAERSVLKLKGERAEKKLAHWQGVAVAAAEQCGLAVGQLVADEREQSRCVEFIRCVEDESVLTQDEGNERIECVHVVDRHRGLRDRNRVAAPVCVDQRLSHECVRTHEARRADHLHHLPQ